MIDSETIVKLNIACPRCKKAGTVEVAHGGAIVSQYRWAVNCTFCKEMFTVALHVDADTLRLREAQIAALRDVYVAAEKDVMETDFETSTSLLKKT